VFVGMGVDVGRGVGVFVGTGVADGRGVGVFVGAAVTVGRGVRVSVGTGDGRGVFVATLATSVGGRGVFVGSAVSVGGRSVSVSVAVGGRGVLVGCGVAVTVAAALESSGAGVSVGGRGVTTVWLLVPVTIGGSSLASLPVIDGTKPVGVALGKTTAAVVAGRLPPGWATSRITPNASAKTSTLIAPIATKTSFP
jgi:hypothetical protein